MFETLEGEVLKLPRSWHATYIDDVTVPGMDWVQVMRDSMYLIVSMAVKGFPLGTDNFAFLSHKPVVLGLEIDRPQSEFRMGSKSLKQLLVASLPRTHKKLQGLLGKINFCL